MRIWRDAQDYGIGIEPGRVVYKGVIFEMQDGVLEIKTSERDFYDPMPEKYMDVFLTDGFLAGMEAYLSDKYRKQLDRINRLIAHETAGRNNQRRLSYLQTTRERVLSVVSAPLEKFLR